MKKTTLQYRVGDLRAAGLEAKWGKARNGTPFIFARVKGTVAPAPFYIVDGRMFKDMQKEGVMLAFTRYTLLGSIFSVAA